VVRNESYGISKSFEPRHCDERVARMVGCAAMRTVGLAFDSRPMQVSHRDLFQNKREISSPVYRVWGFSRSRESFFFLVKNSWVFSPPAYFFKLNRILQNHPYTCNMHIYIFGLSYFDLLSRSFSFSVGTNLSYGTFSAGEDLPKRDVIMCDQRVITGGTAQPSRW
jgi:hypothetical protein